MKEELTHHLKNFDGSIPLNHKVKIVKKKDDYRISVTPLKPQKEPENLTILKQEINDRWSGTSLLDVIKETDLRTNFTRFIESGTGVAIWIETLSGGEFYSACSAWVPIQGLKVWSHCRRMIIKSFSTSGDALFPVRGYARPLPGDQRHPGDTST